MNFARTFLACLIITMMSMSSWASTSMACQVTDSETNLVVESGSKSPHHEHHGEAALDSIDSEVDLPLESSVNKQLDDYNGDCACCGGCISLCAASSSGSAALIVSAMDVNFHQPDSFIIFASNSHSSPSLAPLFRPPSTKTL